GGGTVRRPKEEIQCGLSVAQMDDRGGNPGFLQIILDQLGMAGIILNDQDREVSVKTRDHGSMLLLIDVFINGGVGSVTKKRLPLPGSDSSVIEPPRRSMMRR